jgi:hypothetical protein
MIFMLQCNWEWLKTTLQFLDLQGGNDGIYFKPSRRFINKPSIFLKR